MEISGAMLVLEILEKENIKNIFGYPGGAIMPLYDAIYDYKNLNHYLARHEQGAIHAAEAYGKVNQSIGCCIATSGPGATNFVTGIANANMDSNALLCITGQVAQAAIGKMSFQEIDIVSIVTPIVKKAVQVKTVLEIAKFLPELIYLAQEGRKGPVLIDIPKNLLVEKTNYEEAMTIYNNIKTKKTTNYIEKEDVYEFIKLIEEAKRPLFLIGNGLVKSKGEELFKNLNDKLQIPVVTTLHGIGCFGHSEYYLGMAGMHGSISANEAIHNCDLIISLGSRFDDRLVGNSRKFAEHSKKIHVDIDFEELGKVVLTDLKINGDIFELLKILDKEEINVSIDSWHESIKEFKKNDIKIENNKLTPKVIFKHLNKYVNEKTQYVTDVGQHQMWCAQYGKFTKGNTLLTSGGAGTMGFGLPAAIGASVARPDFTTICVVGDGGIQMCSQEFIVLSQYNLNAKIFIFNNKNLGMVRQWQKFFFEERYSATVLDNNPDFNLLAQANRLKYTCINSLEDLKKLGEVFNSTSPMIIEIDIDENTQVLPMIPPNGSFENTIKEI